MYLRIAMRKLLTPFFVAVISQIGFSQTDPVIDTVYLDNNNNFCSGIPMATLTFVVIDQESDNILMDSIIFPNSSLEYLNGAGPIYLGDTTIFTYYVQQNTVTPPGTGVVVNEDIQVYISSTNGLDPTGIDNYTLTGVLVNGPVAGQFNSSYLKVCNNGLPIDLDTMVSVAGGLFTWGEVWPSTNSNSHAFDPKKAYKYFADDGYDAYEIIYTVTNVNDCKNDIFQDVYFNNPPTAFLSITPSTCGNAVGSVVATLSDGMGPYDVYWSTGLLENDVTGTSITNLSSGVYYLNMTDYYGCKNVAKAPVPDADFSVSASSSASRCVGQPGMVDLTVSVSGGTVDDIFWSNGTTTEDLAAGPGEYSVAIHSTNNCNFYGTYEILDSALRVKLEGLSANFNCLSGPNGYFDITTSGGIMPYAWDWKLNGTSIYTSEDISGIEGGLYSCTVTDDNGCALTWNKTLANSNNVFLGVGSVTKPTCGNANGSIDIEMYGGDVPSVYSWSNGYLTEDISGLAAGNYTLTFADQAGCFSYLTVKLENEKPYQPTICLLTVDTTLIYNMVVWEKDITQNIAGFNIYRETSEYGVFQKVATRPYALESFYQDNAASPVDRSWRYYMTSYDACGGESYGSFIHKTIHVVANTSNGVDYDLAWDNYEGINYTTIDLHRFDPTNGWVTIGPNLPYGTNTFADAPPVIAGLDYLVTFNLADPCTSSKVQDHNSSRSNKSSSVFDPGGSTSSITDEELGFISIYPNPASEMLNLHVDNPELFESYTILDINGKIIASGTIFTNNSMIDLYSFEAGVYILQLNGSNKRVVEKFIKN
jgi:hypothetical protein